MHPNAEGLLQKLARQIPNPRRGLPEEVFLFLSGITPLVNVDLLIKDDQRRVLLTWRIDNYSNPGWHIPGGIIRFKETAAERIRATAREELSVEVEFESRPIAINEIIHPTRAERGHSISLLYCCRLRSVLHPEQEYRAENPQCGAWSWHDRFPESMVPAQRIYRPFFTENPP